MTSRTYKTAQGKTVDLGALILKNEQVRAVGNMGVNARGDVIDDAGRVIDSKSSQVQRQLNKTVSTARPGTPQTAPAPIVKAEEPVAQLDPEEAADLAALEAEFETPELVAAPTPIAPESDTGIAAALAKAKKKEAK